MNEFIMDAPITAMEISDKMNKMPYEMFAPTFCMIAEEWCKANNYDVITLFHDIYECSKLVNDELGKY